jgi:heme/copper-type cytochrome/quinol oxidase subunit 3
VLAAWFTAAFFMLLTFKLVLPAAACGVIALAALFHWGWSLDPPAGHPPVDIGGGVRLPVYRSGPDSQAWWAMVILMLVSGSLYGCLVFSYLYLWTVSPQVWPGAVPSAAYPAVAAALFLAGSGAVGLANRGVGRNGDCRWLLVAVPLLAAASIVSIAAQREVSPRESAYGAIVHALLAVDAFFAVVAITLALFAVARRLAGRADRERRVTFDNARLFWHYTVAQSLAGLALVNGFPRWVY